jgi:hypothetical protein
LLFIFSIKHVFVKGNTRIIKKNIIFTKKVDALFTKIGCHYIIIREIRVMKTLAHETNTYNRKLNKMEIGMKPLRMQNPLGFSCLFLFGGRYSAENVSFEYNAGSVAVLG